MRRQRLRRPPDVPAALRELYWRGPVGLSSVAPDGRWLGPNPAFARMLGYTIEELERLTVVDVTFPADREMSLRQIGRLERGEIDSYELEKRYVRKDGSVMWAHLAVRAVRERGRLSYSVGAVVDITERKAAESACEELAFLVESTDDAVIGTDRRFIVTSWNPAAVRLFGYQAAEMIGRPILALVPPEMREFAIRMNADLSRGARLPTMDVPVVRKDGSRLDTDLTVSPIRGPDGGFAGTCAVARDASQRKRKTAELERRVRERTAFIAAQQEASTDGIFAVGPDMRILSYNKRFAEMWGIPTEILEAGAQARVFDAAIQKVFEPEAAAASTWKMYEARSAPSFDILRLRDGRVFERRSSPIVAPDGAYLGRVMFYRDVTEREKAEVALRDYSRQLAASNADLATYANAASHDLAAPLRKIIVYGELLERAPLDERGRDLLARLLRSARNMTTLVRDILTFSKVGREQLPVEDVDLAEVAREALADLEVAVAETGAQVSIGPLPSVRGHRTLLRRLLQNLLSNAVKFHAPGRPPLVEVQSNIAEGGIEVTMRDNGIGFEPRYAREIFEPFRRLHPVGEYPGSGVGLAICERIARRYGGRLSAEGRPGEGATFTLWLPSSLVSPQWRA